jgi:hypothetical protein
LPSTDLGPVQPLGDRRIITGQAGRLTSPPLRASACIALISIFRFYHIPKDIQKIICELVGEIKY